MKYHMKLSAPCTTVLFFQFILSAALMSYAFAASDSSEPTTAKTSNPTVLPAWKKGGLDSEAAWAVLGRSVQQRLYSTHGPSAVIREVLADLVEFAGIYRGTQEALFALLNHADLAAAIGDHEAAESILRQALEQVRDPYLSAAIKARISQLSIRPGGTPPAFTAKSLDGHNVSLGDYKGKVLLLDFWATWCWPCIAELPNVKKLYKTYHRKGFEILSISLDADEKTLNDFVKKEHLSWTHIYNASLPPDKDMARQYGVDAVPQMILIGRDGKIVEAGLALRGPALEAAVERTVNAKKKSPHANDNTARPLFAALGQPAPKLAVEEWVRGSPTTLNAVKGKVVLLDIFQIICPGCHTAHPEIVRMQKRYKEKGFEVIGLAVAFELQTVQTPKHIRRYVEQQAYPYPVGIDRGLTDTFRRYRARGTPYTVLIDRQGRIRYLDFFRLTRVEALVQQLLDEEAKG